ncbi:MAG TPA: M3 family metallopeptidase [bacterium]|nr:M3 family metallopeptidase [bacterium]
MKTVFALVVLVGILIVTGQAAAADFQAVPEAQKSLYKFDLKRNFYADDAAFEADLAVLTGDITKLEALKGQVAKSADNLYQAYDLNEQAIPVWYKLWVYASLRYSVNTDDVSYRDKIEKISGDLDSRTQFVRTETQAIDDATLERFFREKPDLKTYAFAIEEARRYRPYTLPLDKEELLAELSPYLGSWQERLYQITLDRTNFPKIPLGGDSLDANLYFSVLINQGDRPTRKQAWEGYFHSLATGRDLYAFALTKGIDTRNKLAAMRGFKNYPDSRFFDLYLSYDDVSKFFNEIANHASLRKDYERIRQARIKAQTGYDTVYVWDRQVQAKGFVKPRFDISEASTIIKRVTQRFGPEYQQSLNQLLDPANGRLDIVSGPKRSPGMFSTGYPGAPYQFFAQTFNGYLYEVEGLAHESGHSIHHALQSRAGARPTYLDGPRYVTESIAITNEMLVGYELYSKEKDLEKKAYYLEQFLENALGLLTNNMYANLELKCYEGVEKGALQTADDLDSLTWKMVVPYSIYYESYPEYKCMWQTVHHYYDVPMYNVNYVYAQAIAMVMFDKILHERGFVAKYVKLLGSQFDRPAPEMLRETTGIDIHDPAILTAGFNSLKRQTEELRLLYAKLEKQHK